MTSPQPVDPSIAALNEEALAAVAGGDAEEANEAAERAADAGSLLGVALSTYLRTSHRHDVYDQPAAFEAIQERIQRGDAKANLPVGALLDQLRDLVAMALLFLDEGEHQHLGAAFLEVARAYMFLRHI